MRHGQHDSARPAEAEFDDCVPGIACSTPSLHLACPIADRVADGCKNCVREIVDFDQAAARRAYWRTRSVVRDADAAAAIRAFASVILAVQPAARGAGFGSLKREDPSVDVAHAPVWLARKRASYVAHRRQVMMTMDCVVHYAAGGMSDADVVRAGDAAGNFIRGQDCVWFVDARPPVFLASQPT